MRQLLLILCTVALVSPAEAKPKKKASGASRMESSDFFSCVQSAVNGRTDEACSTQGDSNPCIGLRLAMENSTLTTRCFVHGQNGTCTRQGHKQNDQPQWIGVAAGHLGHFMRCVRARYGSDNESGTQAALADKNLLEFLSRIDDGSGQYGMRKGQILEQSLRGRLFSTIIHTSPRAADIDPALLRLLKGAADNPNVGEPETSASSGDNSEAGAKLNLSQQGQSFANAYADAFGVPAPEVEPFNPASLEQSANITSATSVGDAEREPAALPTAPAVESIASKQTKAPAPNSVALRSYQENPYSLGLDRTLFDRVSLTYRKHSASMENMDLLLKLAPPRTHDVRDEIQRGGAIEL